MFSRRNAAAIAALAACTCLVAAPLAHATVMQELSLEALVRDADAIVVGRVERYGVRWATHQDTLEPRSVAVIRVTEWIRGPGGERVTVEEIGGTWQGGGRWIDGTPRYSVGEEVVVFLRADPEFAPRYRTLGMAQGKFTVMRGVPGVPHSVVRDLSAISFARWADGVMTVQGAEPGPAMELETFLEQVRRDARRVP